MSIRFNSFRRHNLNDPNAKPRYYAIAQKRGKTGIDQLARTISERTTMSRADVYGVLVSLEEVMAEEFEEGRTVELGNIGTFSISLSSKGAESAEAFTASLITKVRIVFRPGKIFKDLFKTLKFVKKP
jgi:predicted histone-like DNA-binding protein